MGQDPITLIIRTLGELYAFILILRFVLQISNADYYNPISQSVVKLTRPVLLPFQKIIPKLGRVDITPLLMAWVVKALVIVLIFLVHHAALNPAAVAIFSFIGTLDAVLTVYFWATLGAVIISWVAPDSYHPAPQLILQITEPLFALARKVIPPIGGLDLSPILIFLAIQIIQYQLQRFVI